MLWFSFDLQFGRAKLWPSTTLYDGYVVLIY
jgi:hypothetical protein